MTQISGRAILCGIAGGLLTTLGLLVATLFSHGGGVPALIAIPFGLPVGIVVGTVLGSWRFPGRK